MRYYDPKTNTTPIWSIDTRQFKSKGCTHIDDMPPEAQQWFTRPAKDGYEWQCLNGKWPEEVPIPAPTPDQIAQQQHQQWKADRQKQVDAIVVEIDGLAFDGDETSQTRLLRAATLADSPEEKIRWILADNTVAEVTAAQLKQAARAAGQQQEALWLPSQSMPSKAPLTPTAKKPSKKRSSSNKP